MPESPDFDRIADVCLSRVYEVRSKGLIAEHSVIAEQLRQVWHAGLEAGGQHETFVKHLKDENTAAHQALDRLDAPKTTQVPRRSYDGSKQDITIGLAARIETALRQVWNARGAADVDAITDFTWSQHLPVPTHFMRAIKDLDR